MHNKQPYSFEKTDVRGRFLLNFSCTKVQSKDVSPIAGNNELVDDFNQMLSKGSLHMAAGNLDSAMYYSGQMHYNLELRDRIVNK